MNHRQLPRTPKVNAYESKEAAGYTHACSCCKKPITEYEITIVRGKPASVCCLTPLMPLSKACDKKVAKEANEKTCANKFCSIVFPRPDNYPYSMWNKKNYCSRNCAKTAGFKLEITKELMQDLYITQKLSLRQVALKVGCSATVLVVKLKELGIPTRNQAQGMKAMHKLKESEHTTCTTHIEEKE